jgi:hypothetical protein
MHELAVHMISPPADNWHQRKHAPGPSSPRKDSIAEPPLSTDGIADSFESNRNDPSHYSASGVHDELYSSTIRIDSCPTLIQSGVFRVRSQIEGAASRETDRNSYHFQSTSDRKMSVG